MSVTPDAGGRRSLEVTFEVAGTPEEVWRAIATGPGIAAWFVPAEFEERDGKPVALTYKFGPGIEPRAELTAWDPPRMFAAQGPAYGDAPPIASEWHVEAREGGKCLVRIVHSLFASTDQWDDQLEGAAQGWSGFLAILKVYLAHFRGQPSALVQVAVPVSTPEDDNWQVLTSALGLTGLAVGQRWATPAGVPAFAGVVEYLTEHPNDGLLRLDVPGPGIAAIGTATYPGGQGMVAVHLYMYGAAARELVDREAPKVEAWLRERFPAPPGGGAGT